MAIGTSAAQIVAGAHHGSPSTMNTTYPVKATSGQAICRRTTGPE